jgi:hypothetical protein
MNQAKQITMIKRFEIFRTNDGFMPYDHDCDEYLYDENGDNCFDSLADAQALVDDAILTAKELENE